LEAVGLYRSADNFEWKSDNLGYDATAEAQVGRHRAIAVGVRAFDIVDAVEPWQLSDLEVGLASFFFHRDYRDYFNRHGAAASVSIYDARDAELTLSYSDQRWGSRDDRTPFSLVANGTAWRPNPEVDEGRFHVANATLRFDTRTDVEDPWSGWYLVADYERGTGDVTSFAPASPLARSSTSPRVTYGRGFLDVRRYNRVGPDAQLNFRAVLGGWLHGDELPLERRFSVGGAGTLPGFDFRRSVGAEDVGTCAAGGVLPPGRPAQCERMALAQVEYRGDLRVRVFSDVDDDDEDEGSWVDDDEDDGDLVERQLAFFEEEHAGLLRDVRDAERAYDRAPRDEAEASYERLWDLVETGTELLAEIRDAYMRTLDEETAEAYEAAFNRAVKKRLPRFALQITDY
jgi:hypothetical protein